MRRAGTTTFARGRPLHGQAHSGQPGGDRAQHAGRGWHDGHEFSLQQCRQGRQRDQARQNNTPFEPLFGTKEARYDPVRFSWLGSRVLRPPWCCSGTRCRSTRSPISRHARSRSAFRRQFDPGLFHPAIERNPRHKNEAHQWLSRSERCAPRHGTARTRRPSQRVFSSVRSTRPDWLRDKTAKAIVQYGAEKLVELPNVPFARIS